MLYANGEAFISLFISTHALSTVYYMQCFVYLFRFLMLFFCSNKSKLELGSQADSLLLDGRRAMA